MRDGKNTNPRAIFGYVTFHITAKAASPSKMGSGRQLSRFHSANVLLVFGMSIQCVQCAPVSPSPCLGLSLDDELVVTIQEVEQYPESPCDLGALGFALETQLRLSVDEQVVVPGESQACDVSTGVLRAVNGWNYQRSPRSPPLEGLYGTYLNAERGDCSATIRLVVHQMSTDTMESTQSALITMDYQNLTSGGDCPASCQANLIGPMTQMRSQ